jgi:hypothetical protein
MERLVERDLVIAVANSAEQFIGQGIALSDTV